MPPSSIAIDSPMPQVSSPPFILPPNEREDSVTNKTRRKTALGSSKLGRAKAAAGCHPILIVARRNQESGVRIQGWARNQVEAIGSRASGVIPSV
jgi:hypothetical protein